MNRRHLIMTAAAASLLLPPAAGWAAARVVVYKTAACGCCEGWIKHMNENGFRVTARDVSFETLMQRKRAVGLKPEQSSCHTGEVGGYIIEGHVPAQDVVRLLKERPIAIGLAVPDMPLGSPGMDLDNTTEPYSVLLIRKDSTAEVFANYP